MPLRIGHTTVDIGINWTFTRLPDGSMVHADHAPQPGQEETARELGMSVDELNRTHDLTHVIIAHVLGLEVSPALHAVAHGLPSTPLHALEEQATLAIQRFAAAARVDLVEVARRISEEAQP